jgi:tRNA pseudouridine32 synthase/23S rRNA pseudouridine746 synthase
VNVPSSRLYLPKLESPPATILEHLVAHFPQIPAATWQERVTRGLVTAADGQPVREDSPYRFGITVFYQKEVPCEPAAPEEEVMVYTDDHILVVDKPHGMVVTPAGDHLERSLLVRLQRRTGCTTLAPMHRLDRETAGILLFTIDPEARGPYHQLFAERRIRREYLALAHVPADPRQKRWRVENRMEAGDPWYRQRIVEGRANAVTEIELRDVEGGIGLFDLRPQTGRKHQLRVHMASIGFPMIGDALYPNIRTKGGEDPPLQLLAARLTFVDPLNGVQRSFESTRKLTGQAANTAQPVNAENA